MDAYTVRYRIDSDPEVVETVVMLARHEGEQALRVKLAHRGLTTPNQFPASAVHLVSAEALLG